VFRDLKEAQRRELPALLNSLGILQVAIGELDSAQKDFEAVAQHISTDAFARAVALFNSYRTALERQRWDEALDYLRQTLTLDPKRFMPFPLDRSQPERILSSDRLGVSFLCRHQFLNAQVIVKALWSEGRAGDVEQILNEAQKLRQVQHPCVLRVHECAYADAVSKARPYIVTEHWDAETLEQHVKTQGPLPLPEAVTIARKTAEALQAVHAGGVCHGDVRPAHVLVRKSVHEPRQTKKHKAGPVVTFEVKLGHFETSTPGDPAKDIADWARMISTVLVEAGRPEALTALLTACQATDSPITDMSEVLQKLEPIELMLRPPEPTPEPLRGAAVPEFPPLADVIVQMQTQLRDVDSNLKAHTAHAVELTPEQKKQIAERIANEPDLAPESLAPLVPQVTEAALIQYVQLLRQRLSLSKQLQVKMKADLQVCLREMFQRWPWSTIFPRERWLIVEPVLLARYRRTWSADDMERYAEKQYHLWRDTNETASAPLRQWELAQQLDTAEAYERFLDGWPFSIYAEEARLKAETLLRRSLLSLPNDPGLRQRYLARRTERGESRDRMRGWMGRLFVSCLFFLIVWMGIGPLVGLLMNWLIPEQPAEGPDWLTWSLILTVPVGLTTGLLNMFIWGADDGDRYAPLGPLPWLAYFESPEQARLRYPDR
jgi:tRNA A-37 threonylcarbamoyl transferase component Bud32